MLEIETSEALHQSRASLEVFGNLTDGHVIDPFKCATCSPESCGWVAYDPNAGGVAGHNTSG
jgi:hypothetical protein